MTSKSDFIRFRIQSDLKTALFELAEKRRIDVSKLLIKYIVQLIDEDKNGLSKRSSSQIDTESNAVYDLSGQLCFRPLPGDELYLKRYAEARHQPPGVILKLILRGWINKNAPMPREELLSLGVTSNQLAAIGRNLNQLIKLAHSGSFPNVNELNPCLKEVSVLTTRASENIDAIVRANLLSWENDDA
jgi:hypothetical protein